MDEFSSPVRPADLQHRFRRLRPETLAAILEYQHAPAPALLPVIVTGILNHYLPADAAAMWAAQSENGGDHPPEDEHPPALDVDSLTMLEIVLDLEDALGVEFDKQELASVRTVPEMQALLLQKTRVRSQG